jgi:phosphoglucomutase
MDGTIAELEQMSGTDQNVSEEQMTVAQPTIRTCLAPVLGAGAAQSEKGLAVWTSENRFSLRPGGTGDSSPAMICGNLRPKAEGAKALPRTRRDLVTA